MSKTYLISGAGSGIGRSIAQKLAAAGNRCILMGRKETKLQQALHTLPESDHLTIAADIRDKESLAKAASALADTPIHALIANSGIGGENYWGENDRWYDIINTNLTGTYHFVNTFLPNLRLATGERHVIVTSSVLARLGVADYPAYCASKAGLLGLMRSWAVQFAKENILVNAICPGWVDTDMAQSGLQTIADSIGITKGEFYDMAMQRVPLRKMSQPEEIADLVYYLVNQRSITGQALDINGGAIMNS
ncbi:SDR family oxidoreductase [Mucilaginibacter sp. RS28]|uniref:SDR family oxidoreductase n=1 Tax=Mucilaginibacter straminoryzae TaxID=2932774 RepID=A0A9X1WZA5_9SPHI|nr:SDR family oxidoreductase [Mucilaginibacter straminoryzae]MCJ8208178.1 SDR family oxidoreductase [Mucilaginibacter straminoryzae]